MGAGHSPWTYSSWLIPPGQFPQDFSPSNPFLRPPAFLSSVSGRRNVQLRHQHTASVTTMQHSINIWHDNEGREEKSGCRRSGGESPAGLSGDAGSKSAGNMSRRGEMSHTQWQTSSWHMWPFVTARQQKAALARRELTFDSHMEAACT